MPPTISALPQVSERLQKTRERILKGFQLLAHDTGPKGVVMAELVAVLGISTKTLYRCFPNKTQLVTALIHSWANEQRQQQQTRMQSTLTPRERIVEAALNWMEHFGQFSGVFWLQLERDFPEAHALYQQEYDDFIERARQNLTAFVKPSLNADLALSALMALLNHADNIQLCDQLNLTRKVATTQMINLWADGALAGI